MQNNLKIKNLFLTTALTVALAPQAFANGLPTGGEVVSGSGNISQSNNTMTIQQDSSRLNINWQDFSIGQGNSVNFVQPGADSVALNNVLGSNVSMIQGSINANGQVFIVNPNGVLFTPDSQVNVGGLVASTQNISKEDFLAGTYKFEGQSSGAIINQGNITAAKGGTVALIAANIINDGNIEAESGNVLLGAGNKVLLDLGGPVKLSVEEGAIDTLIEQNGAIRADGGKVYLTAKAAGDLASSVINHSGVTEANTLSTGKNGEIILLGDMDVGTANISGRLSAAAPDGGDGGFIETSAAKVKIADKTRVTTASKDGISGEWLIDPNDYTVAASGGDISGSTLATNLGSGNVTIQTTGAGGNLYVNDEVAWSANKLTLQANNNIEINSDMTASGTASLAFVYGQDTADGTGSSYSIADDVSLVIPTSSAFTWKKGSDGVVNNLWFGNDFIKFSSNKSAAIDANGALLQPFYYDDGSGSRAEGWYKLTFSNFPLDFAIGSGGDGTNSWNNNGEVLSTNYYGYEAVSASITPAINSQTIDIAGYNEGVGTLVATTNVDVMETGDTVDIKNSYNLGADDNFIKTTTTVTNKSMDTALTNVRLWAGTRDDYVGTSDSNHKSKGNLGDGFEEITSQDEQAKALMISESTDGSGAAVLFYSTSEGADTVSDSCCSFENVIDKDPRTSEIVTERRDGSYALFLRMSDLAAGEGESLVWYYAAGQASEIESIIDDVAQSAGVSTPPDTSTPLEVAITSGQNTSSPNTNTGNPTGGNVNTGGSEYSGGVGSMEVVQLSKAEMNQQSNNGQTAGNTGPTKVFVVDNGINYPSEDDDKN